MEQCYCIAIIELKLSKEEFLDLTPYEFSILYEHYARVKKDDYSILRNTVYNAGANLMRGEGDKEIPLFDEIDNVEDEETRIEELKKEREALFKSYSG
ncbi:hypothetical protein [Priestia megaterium]|uniref:hypothetical protein n=1 Tax=Priestia megaterium TaxID=1404 RepID=UPI000BEBF6B7|nr:hypothetical protein [Priestia megaterium]PED63970.1 hypothetical protein CON20_23675 [Priestia megaterium]